MHGDQVGETHLTGEPIRTAEGLGRERSQVVDMFGPTRSEHRLQQRIGQHAVVEDLLEAVQPVLTASMLEERFHRLT